MTIPSAPPRVGVSAQLLSAASSYRSAGVSGYIRQLLQHLPAAAPDLAITAYAPQAAALAVPGLTVDSSRILDTRRPWQRILWEQTNLPLAARRARLDLIHGTVNIAPRATGCPTIVTIHDLSFMRYPQAFPTLQRTYLRSLVGRSARHARRVIAVSQATADDVSALFGVPAERITVVYNGVDPLFQPAPAAQVEVQRARLGLPERFVLHLGTLEPRKNLVRLVNAFAKVRGKAGLTDVKLVLAGGMGWDYNDILAEVVRLGLDWDVLFPGYVAVQDLPWFYRAASLFVYPSLLEGFGLPVVEAMACGVPAITSSVSSLPEVAGDAARLVDPTSVDALADAMVQVLSQPDLAGAMRERGLRQAARFSWLTTAQQTAAVYRDVLGLAGVAT